MLNLPQDDAFEKWSNLVFWEVVWKFTHLVEEIDVFVEDEREIRFENTVDEEVNVRFFEDMGDLLEQLVERNPTLVVTLLSDLVQSLEIVDFKDGFIDQIPEEFFRFFDELNMAINQINLLKQVFFLDPSFLSHQQLTIALFLYEP